MNRNTFDPSSNRAVVGLRFQRKVQDDMSKLFDSVISTREYLKNQDKSLSESQLNFLEQKFGDIAVVIDSDIIFIECVSINSEFSSPFPESKIKNFIGENKFYAFGWDDEDVSFIHSSTWNSYARNLPSFLRDGRKFRKLMRSNIRSIKKMCSGVEDFRKLFE